MQRRNIPHNPRETKVGRTLEELPVSSCRRLAVFTSIIVPILIGIGVGVVMGALGAGGGILAVPVLVFLLGMDPHDAAASSLVIVGLGAVTSIIHHARAGNVAWRAGALFGGISVIGAVLGARLANLVSAQTLMVLLGVLLVGVALSMFRKARRTRREEDAHAEENSDPVRTYDDPVLDSPGPDHVERADGVATDFGTPDVPEDPAAEHPRPRVAVLLGSATVTGLLTGFFGVGGGFIVVPMLVLAVGLAMRRASGTSLLVMMIATVASMLARLGTDVQVDWIPTLMFAAGSMVGGVIGGPLSAQARPSTLTALFALLLSGVALATLVQTVLG